MYALLRSDYFEFNALPPNSSGVPCHLIVAFFKVNDQKESLDKQGFYYSRWHINAGKAVRTLGYKITPKPSSADYTDTCIWDLIIFGPEAYNDCLKIAPKKRAHMWIDKQIEFHQRIIDWNCNSWQYDDCDEWVRKNMNYYELIIDEVAAICNF